LTEVSYFYLKIGDEGARHWSLVLQQNTVIYYLFV